MSMGSVMMTARAPLKRMFVRQSTHDMASASTSEMAVEVRETVTEFMQAALNCSVPNTAEAPGLVSCENIPSSGSTTAKRKNTANTMRVRLSVPLRFIGRITDP